MPWSSNFPPVAASTPVLFNGKEDWSSPALFRSKSAGTSTVFLHGLTGRKSLHTKETSHVAVSTSVMTTRKRTWYGRDCTSSFLLLLRERLSRSTCSEM